jgi:hypothetical protein
MTTDTSSLTGGAVDRFLDAVLSATIDDCDAWADDAELDATVPNWRMHLRSADAIRTEYRKWFADPATFEELERVPVPGGEVVSYLLAWTQDGVPHTAHHMHLLRVEGDHIVSDRVLCGGRWPQSLMDEMAAAGG